MSILLVNFYITITNFKNYRKINDTSQCSMLCCNSKQCDSIIITVLLLSLIVTAIENGTCNEDLTVHR